MKGFFYLDLTKKHFMLFVFCYLQVFCYIPRVFSLIGCWKKVRQDEKKTSYCIDPLQEGNAFPLFANFYQALRSDISAPLPSFRLHLNPLI